MWLFLTKKSISRFLTVSVRIEGSFSTTTTIMAHYSLDLIQSVHGVRNIRSHQGDFENLYQVCLQYLRPDEKI